MLLNYLRALIYGTFIFPKLKRQANSLPQNLKYPKDLYFLIPSYKEDSWVSVETFRSILSEVEDIPSNITIIVSTSGKEEDKTISQMFQAYKSDKNISLVFQHQSKGKRIAMGHALRYISRIHNPSQQSVTIFMDGDSYLESGFLKKILPYFALDKKLGALTTNEIAYIKSNSVWYKEWFKLKFAQRHILFQSHSLSRKVLTLTGRLSAYRTSIVIKEDFIKIIENDILLDPLHGKFRFLMGDDKSSWFYLLKNRYDMLYIPDALCYSLESRDGDFLKLSNSLPFRWNGNTLRNNTRALKLGMKTTGVFIWFAILDQKITMWSSLVGIVSAVLMGIFKSVYYFLFFIVWILFVRVFQLFILALGGHPVSVYTLPIMLYTQWLGALIKIKAYYDLSNQQWAKGNEVQKNDKDRIKLNLPFSNTVPKMLKYSSFGAFVLALLLTHHLVSIPPISLFANTFRIKDKNQIHIRQLPKGSDYSKIINNLIKNSKDKPLTIILPPSVIDIYHPVIINKSDITIKGTKDKTLILSHLTNTSIAAIQVRGYISNYLGRLTHDVIKHKHTFFLKTAKNTDSNYILLKQPNEKDFLKKLGSKRWFKKYPYIRQEIVKTTKRKNNLFYTKREILTNFEKDKTKVFSVNLITNIILKDFTIKQIVPNDDINRYRFVYKNILPKYQVDLIRFDFSADSKIENIDILEAGRHPLVFENCYNLTANQLMIDKAWNKGKKGNGYFRIARSYWCEVKNSQISNIRHLTLQWSSAGNYLHNLKMQVDINFHGGFTHDNRVKDIDFLLSKKHHWSAVQTTPDDARWAPPDGKNFINKDTITIRKD